MPRIQQLETQVINRIAAGEVIERPGSVVKELLENSVDALASRIDVDITGGGMDLIRIADNGEGIHPEDLELAVTSHATSKIRSDADLDQVATLGFRGEALASIAAVSRFRLKTRPEGRDTGRELESHGGRIVAARDCGCPPGTIVEVHNLFFNTPARRRFLKTVTSEFAVIAEQFTRVALANPRLHLVLRHNGRLTYELPAAADPLERIRRFYGADLAAQLIPVSSEAGLSSGETVRLWGYVGEPSLNRSTRRDQYLFLNGRWIQDRSLQHALQEAYRGLLMVGRHPVSFLFLELPPALVDVNVHPTKSEVRFHDGQLLYRQLLKTLRDKFSSLELRSRFELPAASDRSGPGDLRLDAPARSSAPHAPRELPGWRTPRPVTTVPRVGEFARPAGGDAAVLSHPGVIGALAVQPKLPEPLPSPAARLLSDPEAAGTPSGSAAGSVPETSETQVAADGRTAVMSESGECADTGSVADFRAFQIHDCYIVVAGEAGLEVIDQHALHERILYEHLRNRILTGRVEQQRLLIPEPVECSPAEAAALLEAGDLLAEAGLELQDFGGNTLLLTAFPALIPRGCLVRIVQDLAAQLVQNEGRLERRDLLDRMLHTMACRAAIKSGQRLTPDEMQELLRQRHLVDDSHHCPHGRPTSLMLSRNMLDQQFGRLG